MGSVPETLTAVPLHQRPELVEACAELINEEWKKSKTLRVHSLQRSTDDFPTCLVLIKTPKAAEAAAEGKPAKPQSQLLGHARLSRVVGRPESLLVETVVVSRALRGQGYGRKLMEATECYAKSLGFRHLHLTTHDKQHFYAHLGYALSEPVQSLGFTGALVPVAFLQMFSGPRLHARAPASGPGKPSPSTTRLYSSALGAEPPPLSTSTLPARHTATLHPPPPLPPVPPSLCPPTRSLNSLPPANPPLLPLPPSLPHASPFCSGTAAAGPPPPPPLPPSPAWVSLAHLPPLPPGPPPRHLPLPGQPGSPGSITSSLPEKDPCGQSLLDTPYSDLKGLPIFWMKKDI